jgi:predicted nuclease of predicted toxin-antitoxin system
MKLLVDMNLSPRWLWRCYSAWRLSLTKNANCPEGS